MNLTQFLENNNVILIKHQCEGYSQQIPEQEVHLQSLIGSPDIKYALEIGFNAGHSAEIFLEKNPNVKLFSFDIGQYPYVSLAKKYIDQKYPNRHTLILGNSTMAIPQFFENFHMKFDLIFIDGGHEYETAKADLQNCALLAHSKTMVLFDDTVHDIQNQEFWNVGPTNVWNESIKNLFITQLGSQDYCKGRGMSWGYYNLKETPWVSPLA